MKRTEVNLETLGRVVKVGHSFGAVLKSQQFMLAQSKLAKSMDDQKDFVKGQEAQIKSEKAMYDYLVDALNLSKADQKKLADNATPTAIQSDATRVAYSIQGYPKETIDTIVDSMKRAIKEGGVISSAAQEKAKNESGAAK